MSGTMIEQSGRVVSTDGDSVIVEVERRSSCGHCASGDGCGVSRLGRLVPGGNRQRLRLVNRLDARVGDQVVIATDPAMLLRASVTLYLLPLILMIGTAMSTTASQQSELIVVTASLGALLGGFFIARGASGVCSAPRLVRTGLTTVTFDNIKRHAGVERDE